MNLFELNVSSNIDRFSKSCNNRLGAVAVAAEIYLRSVAGAEKYKLRNVFRRYQSF